MYYSEPLDNSTLTKLGFTKLPTAVKETNGIPTGYMLAQNYPNPFNPNTTIKFSVPNSTHVNLTVYDALGKVISTLVNEEKTAGTYEVDFEAKNLSSGVYFYKITTSDFSATKKLLLMK